MHKSNYNLPPINCHHDKAIYNYLHGLVVDNNYNAN